MWWAPLQRSPATAGDTGGSGGAAVLPPFALRAGGARLDARTLGAILFVGVFGNALPFSLVIGGAIGNLIDRLIHGHVVDFIQWHWKDVYYWTTPTADCGDDRGDVCKDYNDWVQGWTEIKG